MSWNHHSTELWQRQVGPFTLMVELGPVADQIDGHRRYYSSILCQRQTIRHGRPMGWTDDDEGPGLESAQEETRLMVLQVYDDFKTGLAGLASTEMAS